MNVISDLDIGSLVLNGFYIGVVVTFSVGFLAYGLNYALKLFK